MEPEVAIRRELLERELSRRDLETFVSRMTKGFLPGPHISILCEAVADTNIKRLIVEAPPRHGKTQIMSNCTPLWYLGNNPSHEIIVATYNQERADEIGRWAKQQVQDPIFKNVFPDLKLRSDSQAAARLGTTQGGGIKYVGVGSAITGSGANLIIIDDPIKDSVDADSESMSKKLWEWYSAVLRTRLHPGGRILILHTRWRTNDLIGRLKQAQQDQKGETFRSITFRAVAEEDDTLGRPLGAPLHPERYDEEALDAIRLSLLPRDWMALYQQRPLEETGAVFSPSDFQLYKPGTQPKTLHWHIACDGAFSTQTHADHSVIWPYAIDPEGCLWFSPDFIRARIDISVFIDELVRRLCDFKAHSLTMEKGAFFKAIEPELKRRMQAKGVYCQIMTPAAIKDKLSRSRPLQAKMQQGMARWPDVRKTHEVVIPEFIAFTGQRGGVDDIVDTAAWAAIASDTLMRPYADDEPEDDIAQLTPSGHTNLWNMADIEARCPTRNQTRSRYAPPPLIGGR